MSFIDKTPLKSKKFIFGLIGLTIIAGVLIASLLTQTISWPMTVFMAVLAVGLIVIPVGYTLGQAALDRMGCMISSISDKLGGSDDSDAK